MSVIMVVYFKVILQKLLAINSVEQVVFPFDEFPIFIEEYVVCEQIINTGKHPFIIGML